MSKGWLSDEHDICRHFNDSRKVNIVIRKFFWRYEYAHSLRFLSALNASTMEIVIDAVFP
jgi:hypothetical protein